MSNLELNKKLALALGWKPEQIGVSVDGDVYVCWDSVTWKLFDYMDEVVAFRIAEKFDVFPWFTSRGWYVVGHLHQGEGYYLTPQEAIARAVIGRVR